MGLLMGLSLAGALLQAQTPNPTASISGRVMEHGTGAPIAGAQVVLMPQRSAAPTYPLVDRPPTASTDRDGRYEFDNVGAGRYRLSVQRAGFAALGGPDLPEVQLNPGERRTGVDVTLQKGGVIVGRVLDENGEPLSEVRVTALQKPPGHDGPVRTGMMIPGGPSAETNDLGEFRLFSLRPGPYYVQAMPRSNFGRQTTTRGTTLLPTYFPGTTDAAAAQPVSVAGGQTSGEVLIEMIGAAAFQVSGVIVDEAGRPVANAMVRLIVDDATVVPNFMMARSHPSRTDESGMFTIGDVTNGSYVLLAAAPVVIASPPNRVGVPPAGGGSRTTWVGATTGVVGGTVGGGVITETSSSGRTIQYRDDTATRVPITVNQANVSGLEVIVRPPPR